MCSFCSASSCVSCCSSAEPSSADSGCRCVSVPGQCRYWCALLPPVFCALVASAADDGTASGPARTGIAASGPARTAVRPAWPGRRAGLRRRWRDLRGLGDGDATCGRQARRGREQSHRGRRRTRSGWRPLETSRVSPKGFRWFLRGSLRASTRFLEEEIVSLFRSLSLH